MNLLATLVVVTNIGFVACYDTERNGPSWVAYDLEPDEVVRTNRVAVPFRQDPRVPRVSEESLEAAYRGYDRGHLAPAADFNWNREALRQTYYYTNVSPMSPRLNRGPWAANEAEVRRLAESGTVHVVAFPVYGSSGIPERFVKVAYGWFGVKMWDEENDPVPGVAYP